MRRPYSQEISTKNSRVTAIIVAFTGIKALHVKRNITTESLMLEVKTEDKILVVSIFCASRKAILLVCELPITWKSSWIKWCWKI
jgi:hypothetical protein